MRYRAKTGAARHALPRNLDPPNDRSQQFAGDAADGLRLRQRVGVAELLAGEPGTHVRHQGQRQHAQAGVARECVVLDPGIGFGKTAEHNLQLLVHLEHLTKFVRPAMLGLSRKSFIGQSVGAQVEQRLPGSLACASWAVQHGVQIIRAHDVAETVQAIRMTEAILAKQTT